MQVNHVINQLIDFVYGKDDQQDDIGAVARFVTAHKPTRPAKGKPSRWQDVAALKTHARHTGPNITDAQIDAAVAAATAGTGLQETPGMAPPISTLHP